MKVTKIIDPEFKTGTSTKNGKKWALMKIQVGDKEATGFGPVVEGDEVDLTYNEQYKNYSFKLLDPQDIPSRDINDDVKPQARVFDQNNREYQVTRNMVWKNLLGHAGVPTTDAEVKTFMKLVDLHAKYLLGPVVESSGIDKARAVRQGLDKEVIDTAEEIFEEPNEA